MAVKQQILTILSGHRVMLLIQSHGEKVKPLVLISKAASLNMASVNASGCAESKASPICLIMSRFRSACPRTAWAKWIIPETYRQNREVMSRRRVSSAMKNYLPFSQHCMFNWIGV